MQTCRRTGAARCRELLGLSRNLGLIAGASIMGAVFAFGAGTEDFAHVPPGPDAAGMRLTFLLAGTMMIAAILIVFGAWSRLDRRAV